MLLELGPEGDLGSDNAYGLCGTLARQASPGILTAAGISSVYCDIVGFRRHNILGSKHAAGRHAQLRAAMNG